MRAPDYSSPAVTDPGAGPLIEPLAAVPLLSSSLRGRVEGATEETGAAR